MTEKRTMKTVNYRTCHHAGVWTLFVEKEQTSTMDLGLIGRGIAMIYIFSFYLYYLLLLRKHSKVSSMRLLRLLVCMG